MNDSDDDDDEGSSDDDGDGDAEDVPNAEVIALLQDAAREMDGDEEELEGREVDDRLLERLQEFAERENDPDARAAFADLVRLAWGRAGGVEEADDDAQGAGEVVEMVVAEEAAGQAAETPAEAGDALASADAGAEGEGM